MMFSMNFEGAGSSGCGHVCAGASLLAHQSLALLAYAPLRTAQLLPHAGHSAARFGVFIILPTDLVTLCAIHLPVELRTGVSVRAALFLGLP